MSDVGEGHPAPSVVTLQVTTEISGTPEEVLQKQAEAVRLLAGLGGVAVTMRQLGDAVITDTPTDTDAGGEIMKRDQKLIMSIDDLLAESQSGWMQNRARVSRALNREKIFTARDVLAVGKSYIEAVRNFGDGSMRLLEDSLDQVFGDSVRFSKAPSVLDIVALYDSVDELPRALVSFDWWGCDEIKTVGDILYAQETELVRYLGNEEKAHRVLRVAQSLKTRFESAKVSVS